MPWRWPNEPGRAGRSIFAGPPRSRVRLEKEGHTWALAHALYIRAGIAACKEDPVPAIDFLIRSAAQYDLAEMPLRAHLLRYRLGEIEAGPETRALHEQGRAMDQGAGDRLAGTMGAGCMPRASRRSPANRSRRPIEVSPRRWNGGCETRATLGVPRRVSRVERDRLPWQKRPKDQVSIGRRKGSTRGAMATPTTTPTQSVARS